MSHRSQLCFFFFIFWFSYSYLFFSHSIIFAYLHIFKNPAHINSMHLVSKMFRRTEGMSSESGIFERDKCGQAVIG
jgi:hypothetical protein